MSFAITTLNTYLTLLDPPVRSTLLQDISNNIMWFVGPCFYAYTIYQNEKPNKKFIILNSIPYLILAGIEIVFEWPRFSRAIMFGAFIQMCIYLYLTIAYIFKNYTKYKSYYNWILPAVISFGVIVIFNFVLNGFAANNIILIPDPIRLTCTSLLGLPIFFIAYKEMNSTNDFGIQPKKYQTKMLKHTFQGLMKP